MSPQPKLSDQVAELERQLMMHKEMVRDKQQQIDTLRGELNSITHAANKATGNFDAKSAKNAVDRLIDESSAARKQIEIDGGMYYAKLNRIPLYIRRIWGAV